MDIASNVSRLSARITGLDGLRATLALLITAYHLGAPGTRAAVLALPTFYALSGSLITSLLLAEHRRSGTIRLGRFILNRSLRIVPPIVVLVAVVALLWPVVGGYGDSTTDLGLAVTIALTWTTNLARAFAGVRQGVFDPLWSLSAEEQFYVLWPLLVVLSFAVRWGRRWLTVVLAAVIVVGPITCIPLFAPSPDAGPASVYYAPPISMSSLASGCLAALVLDRLRTTGRWRARTGTSVTWCGVGLLAVLAVLLPPGWKSDPVALLGMIPTAGVASALLVTGLGTSDTVLSRALSARPLAWFGARASYSLYIWHMTVAAVVLPLVDGLPGRALALLVAIAVGVLGGVAVEQPADRLRRRLLRPRPPRVETS